MQPFILYNQTCPMRPLFLSPFSGCTGQAWLYHLHQMVAYSNIIISVDINKSLPFHHFDLDFLLNRKHILRSICARTETCLFNLKCKRLVYLRNLHMLTNDNNNTVWIPSYLNISFTDTISPHYSDRSSFSHCFRCCHKNVNNPLDSEG